MTRPVPLRAGQRVRVTEDSDAHGVAAGMEGVVVAVDPGAPFPYQVLLDNGKRGGAAEPTIEPIPPLLGRGYPQPEEQPDGTR